MNKIQKQLDFTCQICQSFYQILEIHHIKPDRCKVCLAKWKTILHQHYQEQIILHLAQEEARKDKDHDQN